MLNPSQQAKPTGGAAPHSAWYVTAMEGLIGVVQDLSQARDLDAIAAIVRDAARQLTGADGATFVLRDGDQCYYADENAISPLWKGKRFPMSACISGWVMLNARSTVIEDIYSDDRIPADAYRPTFVKSLAMVPIRSTAPIGAIGNYWASRRRPTEEEVAILQALADTTSVAMHNAQLYGELQRQVRTLEEQRTRIHDQRDALEVFTRALAHDLKEPVRSIRSFAEIIRRPDLAPDKAQQYFGYIQRAADRMGMLIEKVFRYTQLDDPERAPKEPCSMAQTLESVKENLDLLIREHDARVTGSALPDVQANPAQMIRVLQNLIANAVRHNNAPVTVSVGAEDGSEQWKFFVRDNGQGIAAEHAEMIFLPFKRLNANAECAGLGLPTCRKIVAMHGGRIWCESTPGQGATFFFTLPKAAAAVPAETMPEDVARPTATAASDAPLANVLLVDDLEDHLELTRLILFDATALRCNVMTARDGSEALDLIRKTISAGEHIDLILLDINMPKMNGFEMMERLRQDDELKDLPVIMCTGSTYDEDRRRAKSLGAAGYLVKPPSWDRLKPILEEIDGILFQHGSEGTCLVRAA
jgi:two-component system CheB/CheR fusion protein